MNYRRNRISGASYFFTVVTYDRQPLLESDASIKVLRHAFRTVMNKYPFTIDAIVIMPDHLHCVWTLPSDDANYALRWRLIKTWCTKHANLADTKDNQSSQGPRQVWQQRYWEHTLRDHDDFTRHVEYIHFNPVKHGYTAAPGEWLYSSFHKYVRLGIYPFDWCGNSEQQANIGRE